MVVLPHYSHIKVSFIFKIMELNFSLCFCKHFPMKEFQNGIVLCANKENVCVSFLTIIFYNPFLTFEWQIEFFPTLEKKKNHTKRTQRDKTRKQDKPHSDLSKAVRIFKFCWICLKVCNTADTLEWKCRTINGNASDNNSYNNNNNNSKRKESEC